MKPAFFLRFGLVVALLALGITASAVLGEDQPYRSYLPQIMASEPSIPIATVLTPFEEGDHYWQMGPSNWGTNYGERPEIIVASNGAELDVLANDFEPGTPHNAVLLHIKSDGTRYKATQALTTNIPMLNQVMGLANDSAGNRYYATGIDEAASVNPTYPAPGTYRSNIVRVVKLNKAGTVLLNIDLDLARHAFDSNAEMIINPMTFGSARLAVGGNEIALVHSINTNADGGGTRHQKALSTRLDATSGAITRTSSVWVSHSFDQRLLYDGAGIIENHLGDAFPRNIVFARNHQSYPLFHIKGSLGQNNTYTRLGNVALIANDPTYKYIALFATESCATTADLINGPRNLAIVRVKGTDNSIDPNLPNTLTVSVSDFEGKNPITYNNKLRWLTSYSAASNLHAERPKLVAIGGDQYIVLWEEWLFTGETYQDRYIGVYGMLIDAQGNILRPARLITSQHHLLRGDDAFFLNNRAAWMTGSASQKKLYIHFVDSSLNYEMVTVE